MLHSGQWFRTDHSIGCYRIECLLECADFTFVIATSEQVSTVMIQMMTMSDSNKM